MIIADLKSEKGESLVQISLPAKNFKTGSRGYFGMAKVEIDGKRYQVQIQLVEIGSKPETAEK